MEQNSNKAQRVTSMTVIIATALFLLGLLMGYFVVDKKYKNFIYSFTSIRTGETDGYVRSLLGTDSDEATTIGVYNEVKRDVVKIAEEYSRRGELDEYGVYVKSLVYPLWFGINERNEFLPASLYKLPVAMAVYRDLENGKISRDEKLLYTREMETILKKDSYFLPTTLQAGHEYSVIDLIKRMIGESDNGAKDLLVSAVSEETLAETFKLASLDGSIKFTHISPWMYSFYLRILYNTTYINSLNSEELLSYLESSTYKNALVKGVPDDIKVAHKYGLYNNEAGGLELHDCGIFYATEDPYILCVMTKGRNLEELEAFIAKVSEKVYKYQRSLHN